MRVLVFDFQGTLVKHGTPSALFPDSRACLQALDGATLALVSTGTGIENLEVLLTELGIRQYFRAVLHLQGTTLRKEDGSAFLVIAETLGVPPSELLVIGDVPAADIAGAHRCGAKAIRVRRGKYARINPRSAEEHADIEILNLSELPTLLETLNNTTEEPS